MVRRFSLCLFCALLGLCVASDDDMVTLMQRSSGVTSANGDANEGGEASASGSADVDTEATLLDDSSEMTAERADPKAHDLVAKDQKMNDNLDKVKKVAVGLNQAMKKGQQTLSKMWQNRVAERAQRAQVDMAKVPMLAKAMPEAEDRHRTKAKGEGEHRTKSENEGTPPATPKGEGGGGGGSGASKTSRTSSTMEDVDASAVVDMMRGEPVQRSLASAEMPMLAAIEGHGRRVFSKAAWDHGLDVQAAAWRANLAAERMLKLNRRMAEEVEAASTKEFLQNKEMVDGLLGLSRHWEVEEDHSAQAMLLTSAQILAATEGRTQRVEMAKPSKPSSPSQAVSKALAGIYQEHIAMVQPTESQSFFGDVTSMSSSP